MTSSRAIKWKKQIVKIMGLCHFTFLKCIEKSNNNGGSVLVEFFLAVLPRTHVWGSSAFCFFC